MRWVTFGSYEVYADEDTRRIEARVFKHERGFGAMLTPQIVKKDDSGFLGYYITLDAAQQAVESALEKAMVHGIKEVGIKVQGPGSGRETAVKSVGAIEGLRISFMKDVTPLPHNGCRAPKRRRV